MAPDVTPFGRDYDPRFKVYYDLMQKKVRDILLVSSLYDACIMEEDSRLAERINNEYRGLNLSQPPRLTWVSSAEEAMATIEKRDFDLVITMPRLADTDAFRLGEKIKKLDPDLPVILLTHAGMVSGCNPIGNTPPGIDRTFVWTGNSDLLLALIKSVEDQFNVAHDTATAGVRVILLVEDSPDYLSSILPILYREVVSQTQAVLEEKLNEEDRLLTMRARAKILVAESYEEALAVYSRYKSCLLGVISDVRFTRGGELDENAGIEFLNTVKRAIPDIPLLLTSSEPANRYKASSIPAVFIDKNSPSLSSEIRDFFLDYLGFGDFVFRLPGGNEIGRVSKVRSLEKMLPDIPDESLLYHARNNDFSRWLFARSETMLASRLRPATAEDFEGDPQSIRDYLITSLEARRKWRQKGVVADFEGGEFDPDTEFLKIGKGSLGGKARGLAFISTLLKRNHDLFKKYPLVDIMIPRTLVLTTEVFDTFIQTGRLGGLSKIDLPDEDVARAFKQVDLPAHVIDVLRSYLSVVRYPLAVRSSGLLEDAMFQAYAGLYRTYMIPNDDPNIDNRLAHLVSAIKLVYSSTFFQGPKAFARRVGQRTEDEKMAVIVQELVGESHNGFFYPAISGVAQSHNYYPVFKMKPEDGIATVCLGLGKTVVEGGKALRFCPKYPAVLPQFSSVEAILENAQRQFYALELGGPQKKLGVAEESSLERREVYQAVDEEPVRLLASTYIPEEHRIRDTVHADGQRIITFASILKYKQFPLAELLADVLSLVRDGMGAPVEMEFSVHLCRGPECQPAFTFLQVRPMSAKPGLMEVEIGEEDLKRAFCYAGKALGNTAGTGMMDILYVVPERFDPVRTVEMSREISQMNAELCDADRPYLLIGPGRWGSADRWLGIPVQWTDISGVGAMVETVDPMLKAEPSQGSHFFHNVTTLGINYLTVSDQAPDFIDWDWLTAQPVARERDFIAHVRLDEPVFVKVDGRKSHGVILVGDEQIVEPITCKL